MGKALQFHTSASRQDAALMFLLGLISTWQILQVAGIALSTLLTLVLMVYFIFLRKPVVRQDKTILLLAVLYTITTVLSLFVGFNGNGFLKASLIGYVQWIGALVLCYYVSRESKQQASDAFMIGLDWSCRVQLGWCVLQILCYKGIGLDINDLIFDRLLHMTTETSMYRNGTLVCTGLHWHAASLVPVLVFTFFRHQTLLPKLLCIAIAYLTKHATTFIAIFMCVGCQMLVMLKRILVDQHGRVRRRNAIITMVVVAIGIALSGMLWAKLSEMILYLLQRFWEALNPSTGNESSATHLGYYTKLPYIYSQIPWWQILFGTGLGTSGYYFGEFYLQFPGVVWVVESDVVNELLSTGILGAIAHYSLLLVTMVRLRKAERGKHQYWMFPVLAAAGVLYNNQFIWVKMLEMMLYYRAKNQLRRGNKRTNS